MKIFYLPTYNYPNQKLLKIILVNVFGDYTILINETKDSNVIKG